MAERARKPILRASLCVHSPGRGRLRAVGGWGGTSEFGHHGWMSSDVAPDGDPVLETDRLRLRRWVVADAALQHRLWIERDARVPAHRRISGVYVAEHSEVDVRPFFLAALGYQAFGDTDAVDPLRCGPQLAFNPIAGDAPGRGRTHFDVFVPADQARARVDAALAAGGRLADDSHAPDWWSLASPDNHGMDIAAWTDSYD